MSSKSEHFFFFFYRVGFGSLVCCRSERVNADIVNLMDYRYIQPFVRVPPHVICLQPVPQNLLVHNSSYYSTTVYARKMLSGILVWLWRRFQFVIGFVTLLKISLKADIFPYSWFPNCSRPQLSVSKNSTQRPNFNSPQTQ
jgi:hypothetical protein